MKKRLWQLSFIFMLVTVLFVTFTGQAAPQAGGTLVVGLDSDPPMLDPHLSTAKVDRQIFKSLYDSLVNADENMQIVPGLAESWEIEDGGKTYIFKLRDDVTFHDGTKFNAEAVKFNFDRMKDPAFASPRKSELDLITNVKVTGEYEVRVELEKSFVPLLASLADRAGMMVSPTAVRKLGADFANNPVGTGAFKFESRVIQDKLVLVKNENYWQKGLPYLDKVVFRPYSDSNVRAINLTSGDIDLVDEVAPKDVDKLIADKNIKVEMSNGLGFQGMWINKAKAPFNNDALTQAFASTINRDAIVKVVFGDTAIPANSPFPPGTAMHDEERKTPLADIKLAKEKMKEGGKPDGFTVKLMVSNSPTSQQVAQLIQAMAAPAGIKVEIELLEFGTLLERQSSGNYQASLLGWSGRVDPDGSTYRFFHTTGGLNDSNYSNPGVDALLDRSREVTDPRVRKEMYGKLNTYLDRDLPYIFLYHPKEIAAYKTRVHGFKAYPDALLRLQQVWLE